ncbi:uncharacterized protein EV154DRAFT_491711 [Mucor mucedo]|uniref:uncharacterized protein n=1 Tax=Mucor mucedo TaxID=29922 RepID=UPI002220FEC3|nr:uncharacterized protein EV154DRAFT_491711 [Mucor mucedo]KAI7896645.1 hypothetical protein EV154DRAFT_491711 [Mucor mucedo]
MSINYFYHTPGRKWNLIEAISLYDSSISFGSFFELLSCIKKDIVTVGQTQTSMKKYQTAPLNDINVNLFLA